MALCERADAPPRTARRVRIQRLLPRHRSSFPLSQLIESGARDEGAWMAQARDDLLYDVCTSRLRVVPVGDRIDDCARIRVPPGLPTHNVLPRNSSHESSDT